MAGRKPDYNVCISKANGEKSRATRIGAAWRGESGQINVRIGVPLLFTDSYDLVLFERKDDEPEV